jgi:hypothetical protein
MAGVHNLTRYRVGDNPELDEKFTQFKKVNLFVGLAYHNELSKEEAKNLIRLWGKARRYPRRLSVQEVSSLVEFYERIMSWRRRRRRELTRIRNEKARRKLRDAAKEGNVEAVIKLRSIKKADVAKSAKYRKAKKELRDKMKKSDVQGKREEV